MRIKLLMELLETQIGVTFYESFRINSENPVYLKFSEKEKWTYSLDREIWMETKPSTFIAFLNRTGGNLHELEASIKQTLLISAVYYESQLIDIKELVGEEAIIKATEDFKVFADELANTIVDAMRRKNIKLVQ